MSDRELNYQQFIRSLVSIADVASRLETAHREQIQSTWKLAKDFDMKWDQRLGIEDEAFEREEEEIFDSESQGKPYRPNQSRRPVHPYGNYYRLSRANQWAHVKAPRKRRRHVRKASQGEREVGGDMVRAMKRLAGVSNDLENGLVKRIDVLLQRVQSFEVLLLQWFI